MSLNKIIRKNIEKEAEWASTSDKVSPEEREPYKKGYIEARMNILKNPMIYFPLIALFMMTINNLHFNNQPEKNKAREQRIIEFYQKNGSLPNDATPAYLDLRTQLWLREVEQDTLSI